VFAEIDTYKDGKIKYEELHSWAIKGTNASSLLSDIDTIWRLSLFVFNDDDIGSIMLDAERYLGTPLLSESRVSGDHEIRVRDRKSGQVLIEKIPSYIKIAMRMMYANWGGRVAVSMLEVKRVLNNLTAKQGLKYDDPASAKDIPKFVQFHKLNMDEIAASPSTSTRPSMSSSTAPSSLRLVPLNFPANQGLLSPPLTAG
jgi:hypothetical protein